MISYLADKVLKILFIFTIKINRSNAYAKENVKKKIRENIL